MNKFNSIDELRSVKRRLYFKKEELEVEMKNNVAHIKDSFTPSGIFHRLTGTSKNGHEPDTNNVATPEAGNGIVKGAAAAVLDLVINDLFFRRSSYVKKFVASYVIRIFGPAVMSNAAPVIKNLVMKSGLLKMFKTKETAVDH